MFFILSKTVALLFLPSNLLIILALVGVLLLATRWWRAGIRLMAASLILLAVVGFLPIGNVLVHVLESRFPPWNPARGTPDGIIVLGGGINPPLSYSRHDVSLTASAERVTIIAKLARQYPNARIVYSGGNGVLFPQAPPEADFALPLLESFGVDPSRVTLETRSHNTYENALFSKELIKPKPGQRWLLVTSAWHMPRAMGCFRRVGFPVEAYPVNWLTAPRLHWYLNTDFGGGLQQVDFVTHEWLGLLAYWVTGRTGTLLPGPMPAS
jgi:uncharacterized SAM-binding protein YcdF (DUF218 family)